MDKVVIRSRADHTPLCTDNSGRDGLLQTEGIPDRHDPFPHPQLVRIPGFNYRQAAVRLDLDQRNVRIGVLPDHLCLILLPIGELHQNLIRLFDDMVVCKDIAVIADDEPGTQAALLELTLGNISEKTLEKIIPTEIAAEG